MSENKINNNEVINPMAHYIIETLNEMLNSYRNICHIHKLDRVLSAYQQRFSDKVLKFDYSINDVVNRHVIYNNQLKEYIKFYLITVITRERNFRDLKVPNSGLIRSGLWFFVKKSVFCQ
jgi:hypothetical protein